MTEKERAYQRKLEARLIAERNAEKSKNVVKAGNMPSQWGRVVQNEQRLIDNGHYMKTSEGARLDYLREEYRKRKKLNNGEKTIVRVTKKG